jgi:hypothetical protein
MYTVFIPILYHIGQGESAHTLVLIVKMRKFNNHYFWNFDFKFDFKTIKLVK